MKGHAKMNRDNLFPVTDRLESRQRGSNVIVKRAIGDQRTNNFTQHLLSRCWKQIQLHI